MTKHLTSMFCGLWLIMALSSCKVYPPEYKRVENFSLEHIDKEGFKVQGNIIMYNPNKVRVKLSDMVMDVKINGKHVATAGQLVEVPIKAKSEFFVPINLIVKPDMSLLEGLKDVLNFITKKETDLTLEGVLVVKAYGVRFTIPVRQEEKVDLSKLK